MKFRILQEVTELEEILSKLIELEDNHKEQMYYARLCCPTELFEDLQKIQEMVRDLIHQLKGG